MSALWAKDILYHINKSAPPTTIPGLDSGDHTETAPFKKAFFVWRNVDLPPEARQFIPSSFHNKDNVLE
jgi:hypothetical protein